MRRFIPLVLAGLLLVSCGVSCGQKYPDYTDPGEAAYIRDGMEYVIHAGGTLDGIDESNVARTYDGSKSAEGCGLGCVAVSSRSCRQSCL